MYDGATIELLDLPAIFGSPPEMTDLLDGLQSRQFLMYTRVGGGIALTSASRPLSYFRIDWALLDRRRAAEVSKLQMVQRYAYTKDCRRAFILRYFGDPAARQKCKRVTTALVSLWSVLWALHPKRASHPKLQSQPEPRSLQNRPTLLLCQPG